jgi:hypothetical protein
MEYSKSESKRFGLNIYRDNIKEINAREILNEIKSKDIDLAILRLPAEKQFQVASLENIGLPYLIADTLVFYDVNLENISINPLKNNDLEFILCENNKKEILEELVGKIFIDYTNHYYANPYLKKELITEGYKEWACSYINKLENNKIAWLLTKNSNHIGFFTSDFSLQNGQIILGGISPEFKGNGFYTDFIRFIQTYYKDKKINKIIVSTQIQNYIVQRVWSKEGFKLSKALITIHINAFRKKL